jgi:hypothetical protein
VKRIFNAGTVFVALVVPVVLVSACIPASEPHPPAGAAGFSLEPSPAAGGAPFQSGEWTLTIEKLVVAMRITVVPASARDPQSSSGSSAGFEAGFETIVFNGAQGGQFFAPGVSVGRADLCLHYSSPFTYPPSSSSGDASNFLSVGGIDPSDLDRLKELSDEGLKGSSSFGFGQTPTVLLDVKGRRGGQVVLLRSAPLVTGPLPSESDVACPGVIGVDIQASALSLARLAVRPERAFAENEALWRAIVGADANGDGITTGAELRAAQTDQPQTEQRPKKGRPEANTNADATALQLLTSLMNETLLTPHAPAE